MSFYTLKTSESYTGAEQWNPEHNGKTTMSRIVWCGWASHVNREKASDQAAQILQNRAQSHRGGADRSEGSFSSGHRGGSFYLKPKHRQAFSTDYLGGKAYISEDQL